MNSAPATTWCWNTPTSLLCGVLLPRKLSPQFLEIAAKFLLCYGADRVIMSIGMWGPNNALMLRHSVSRGLASLFKRAE